IIWEGDNYMLAQQTVRYLIKTANSIACGESVGVNDTSNALTRYYNKGNRLSAAQLYTWANRSPSEIVKSKQLLLDILAYRFAVMVQQLATKVYVEKRPFEDFLVTAQTVCTAHAEFIVCLYFGKHIEKLPANSPLRPALDAMYCISALSFLTRNTGELYALPKEASVTRELIEALNTEYLNSIKAARTIAVPLVDALKVPDETLNSSLGREDGKVYEDYMARALEEPLNRDGTGDAIRKSFFDNFEIKNRKSTSADSQLKILENEGSSPGETDSFMYQTVGQSMVRYIAECMELPLYQVEIKGKPINQELEYTETVNDEAESVYELLKNVLKEHPDIGGVSVGAILSTYQANRVQNM
ncbi:Diphthine-ammonia ligase, partial [Zancudomyces culisetae]